MNEGNSIILVTLCKQGAFAHDHMTRDKSIVLFNIALNRVEMETLKSYDPLAYYVNTLVDIDPRVVRAHKEKDAEAIKALLAEEWTNLDVHICVNKHLHAFVLCVSVGTSEVHPDLFKENLMFTPEETKCWRFELCFENQNQRTYKLRKVSGTFKDVKGSIQKSFYIGRYESTPIHGLEFAALRAAPHRYSALISDCVEFAKEFCHALLSYCRNGRQLEKEVIERLAKATATGLSVEHLSRKVQTSAIIGNSFLGGVEISSILASKWAIPLVLLLVFLLLIYPIVVTMIIVKIML